MALTLSSPNIILLPGLVPGNITPLLSLLKSLKVPPVVIIVTESSCVDNLKNLNGLPNVYIHALAEPHELADQQNVACDIRLYQWYKFNFALKILQRLESQYSFVANRIFKLRFDYIYSNPSSLVSELIDDSPIVDDILFCESDRIFFGSRLTLFSLRHFLDVAVTLFLNKIDYFYPLHHSNLKKSSLHVHRWERLVFDRRIFDCPSIHELRSTPTYLESFLAIDKYPDMPPSPPDLYSFHTGNSILAAERSFAWYLNAHVIIPRHHSSMSGGIFRS